MSKLFLGEAQKQGVVMGIKAVSDVLPRYDIDQFSLKQTSTFNFSSLPSKGSKITVMLLRKRATFQTSSMHLIRPKRTSGSTCSWWAFTGQNSLAGTMWELLTRQNITDPRLDTVLIVSLTSTLGIARTWLYWRWFLLWEKKEWDS